MYDLNTLVVFLGTILGSFLVYLFSNFIGKPSQKFGLPFAVLLRSSLGFKGAKYFGLLRSLVGIFLFGIQTYFLSKILVYLIRILLFTVDESILYQNIFKLYIKYSEDIKEKPITLCTLALQKQNKSFQFQVL